MKYYNRAIERNKQALEIRRRLFPVDHQGVAETYNNIGLAHEMIEDSESEIEHYELALEMRRRLFPWYH